MDHLTQTFSIIFSIYCHTIYTIYCRLKWHLTHLLFSVLCHPMRLLFVSFCCHKQKFQNVKQLKAKSNVIVNQSKDCFRFVFFFFFFDLAFSFHLYEWSLCCRLHGTLNMKKNLTFTTFWSSASELIFFLFLSAPIFSKLFLVFFFSLNFEYFVNHSRGVINL